MNNPFLTEIDPKFLETAKSLSLCQGCGIRRAQHEHHREHKAMGGRKGAAKVAIEERTNKIWLCEICHMASHLEHGIAADGFHCGTCPKLKTCYWGKRTLGHSVQGLSPNW